MSGTEKMNSPPPPPHTHTQILEVLPLVSNNLGLCIKCISISQQDKKQK